MKNLDDVLKKSLTPAESEEGPDFWLNQNILKRADRQERGAKTMKKIEYFRKCGICSRKNKFIWKSVW